MKGLWKHFLITWALNYKSKRAILYGYAMPVLFLIGFAAVFRSGQPRLLGQMGQILTITILGSTCLGMATALVSERERGLWRYFQLLPIPTHRLLVSVVFVRFGIVMGAIILQLLLANWIYKTPFPNHPLIFLLCIPPVFFGFLGLGFIITALAKDVPSVQALGQCIFLPMILIGGVGIPLYALPDWAIVLASFTPGRYAVELLQTCYSTQNLHPESILFPMSALVGIGLTSLIAGIKLIQWDVNQPLSLRALKWVSFGLFAWIAVGFISLKLYPTDNLYLPQSVADKEQDIDSLISSIDFEILPEDNGFYTPLAPPLEGTRLTYRMKELQPRLQTWDKGKLSNQTQSIVNLLSVAANADIVQDRSEAIIARMVFDQMKQQVDQPSLEKQLAWIITHSESCRPLTVIPELGLSTKVDEGIARERCNWYARKFLGRLIGVIPENT